MQSFRAAQGGAAPDHPAQHGEFALRLAPSPKGMRLAEPCSEPAAGINPGWIYQGFHKQ